MFGVFWSTLAGAYLSDSDNSNNQSGGGCLFSIILFVILFFSEDIRDVYEEAWEANLALNISILLLITILIFFLKKYSMIRLLLYIVSAIIGYTVVSSLFDIPFSDYIYDIGSGTDKHFLTSLIFLILYALTLVFEDFIRLSLIPILQLIIIYIMSKVLIRIVLKRRKSL